MAIELFPLTFIVTGIYTVPFADVPPLYLKVIGVPNVYPLTIPVLVFKLAPLRFFT